MGRTRDGVGFSRFAVLKIVSDRLIMVSTGGLTAETTKFDWTKEMTNQDDSRSIDYWLSFFFE